MKSNYKRLGKYIRVIDKRNKNLEVTKLLGVSVKKIFIDSIANTVGTDFKKYKIVKRHQFTYIADTSRRGDKIGLAMLVDYKEALVSQAYTVFEITNHNELDPEYLMMWFCRPEFDRYARFKSHGSVREIFDWEEMCDIELPIPYIQKQHEIVKEYNTIVNLIKLNEQLNQKLEETAQGIFKSCFHWDSKDEWELTRLGDIIEIRGGFSYQSKDLAKGKSYLLGMGCISFTNRFLEGGMRLYSDDFPDQHLVKPREIVIATRQQSENMPILGYPAMVPSDLEGEKLIAASNLYRVINNSGFNNEILYQLFRSSEYIEHIRLNTKGTTVGMITKDAIEDFYFKLPPPNLINKLQAELKTIVDLIFLKRKEIKCLFETKSLLLSKMTKVETFQF